jgi:O-antigen biosynthesis protein
MGCDAGLSGGMSVFFQDIMADIEEQGLNFLNHLRKSMGVLPAVSVVVPNYNHAPYLEERLESVYGQNFRDIEVILLDDASTDQSMQLLVKYKELYPEMTVLLCNETNSGSVFQQWKKGVVHARSKILWIAESDDASNRSFLSMLLPQMNDPTVMLGYCQSYCMGGTMHDAQTYVDFGYYDLLGRERWYHDYVRDGVNDIVEYFAVFNIIPNVSSTLIRNTELMDVLDECCRFKLSGDWFFYLRHLEAGKIAYLAQPLNYHRRHSMSVIACNRNEVLLREFEEVHYWIATHYLLSVSVKEQMLCCVADLVYARCGKQTGKTLEELYEVEKIALATPDV